MVRSMIAGVAGLKSHQSKLDVIGNNIANVNTWSFKSYSYNFQDAMYTNSINSTGGSQLAGAAGGHNASQVGYGSQLSSISTEFNTGAPAPSSNNMDCMIDGTGFFLVGNMVNGSFDNIESSGLSLSRVGIFRVDNNGYLVDNQGSYVYGYAPIEGTGTPEVPETPSSSTIKDLPVDLQISTVPGERSKITIAGITVETSVKSVNDFEDAVNDWITAVGKMDQYVTATDDDIADTTVTLYKYENGAYTEVTDPADRTGELFKLNPGLMGKGPVKDANGEIQTDPATGEIMLEDKFIEDPQTGEEVSVSHMLKAKKYGKIYFMVGINELGTGNTGTFQKAYERVLRKFQKWQPDAVIYIQGIIPVSKEKSSQDAIFNNVNINDKNVAIAQLADGRDIFYLDVSSSLTDKNGHLKKDYTFDDIHMYAQHYGLWTEYLMKHAVVR